MYAVDGTAELPEQTLDWLPGHAHSAPVRVGNAAATQQQNDVWGEVLDTLFAARAAGLPDAIGQEKLERALLDNIERATGGTRATGSGRFVAPGVISCTPNSWPGSVSTELSEPSSCTGGLPVLIDPECCAAPSRERSPSAATTAAATPYPVLRIPATRRGRPWLPPVE